MYRGDTSLSPLEIGALIGVLAFSILRALPILFTYLPRIIDLVRFRPHNNRHMGARDIATLTTGIASWVQLAFDIFLGSVLMMLAWH
jgi:hypothetical protein